MQFLVVEGNRRENWEKRAVQGGVPYHKRFKTMLRLLQPQAKVDFAFPADNDILPSTRKLVEFDGVLWTGSGLHVNDSSPAVSRQLSFAEDVFKRGVPFYGSCWGLQIATVVAGGKVGKCSNGMEFGISDPIELTEAGKNHPCFQGRNDRFHVLSIHRDEVIKTPENSTILAKNKHSKIQALTFKYRKSEFFGVQYHPEFTVSDMAYISRNMAGNLIEEGFFNSIEDVETFASNMENNLNLPETISDYELHIQEVKFWLEYALKSNRTRN